MLKFPKSESVVDISCFSFLVLSLISTKVCSGTEIYVQDGYGNVVFNNRSVKYIRPVPVGKATYTTKLYYDAKGLDVLYDAARSFVQDVQPNSFPFDLLEKAANYEFDVNTDSQKLVEHFSGLTTCFVIGVASVAVFIVSGFCFCCCRGCCGNCGGDETQVYDGKEGCMRMGLSQALFLMILCVASAAVCIYVTNDRFTDAIRFTNTSVTSNIEDIDRFLKNTGEQFQYTVTDMYEIVHQALEKDLSEMGNLSALFIEHDLQIDKMVAELNMLNDYVNNASIYLGQTRLLISDLQKAEADMIAGLEALADDVETTQAMCIGACVPNLCFDVVPDDIRWGSPNKTGDLPDLNETLANLIAFNASKLVDAAAEAIKDLETVAQRIDRLAGNIKDAVNETLNDYRTLINSLADGVFRSMTESFPADEMKRQTSEIFETVGEYDKYRRWFGFGLTTFFVVIIAFILLGMFLGTCFDDVTVLPTERSSVSNLAGNILLFAVAVLFLAGALLTLLAAMAFLFGGLLEKGCEPVEDLTVFRDFLDQDKVPGFSTSQAILGVTTIHLKAYEVLIGCRANNTPWVAFRMGEVVPLEEYIRYVQYLGDVGQTLHDLQYLDISAYKVLSNRLSSTLSELKATGLESIDFQLINTTIELPTLLFNADDTLTTLQNIASNCNSPVKERWQNHFEDLKTIKDSSVVDEDRKKIQLNSSVFLLRIDVEHIENLTDSILHIAKVADEKISKNMTGVLLQASVGLLGHFLSLVDGYATEVTYMIYNDLGNCVPLWNLYKSMTVVLCDYGVDTLNGYWFSIGLGIFLFCPMIVVGTKLSKHYKTMEVAVGYKSYYNFMADPSGPTYLPDVTDGYGESKL